MHQPLFLFLGDLGGSEIMLILVVILIFFGANKIPELARGLGKGIREFKDASTEIRKEFEGATQPTQPQQTAGYQPQQPIYAEPGQPTIPLADQPIVTESLPAEPAAAPAIPTGAPAGTQARQPYSPPTTEV